MVLGSFLEGKEKFKGLDIGTGTGILTLMLAQRNPELKITAIEIDSDSAQDATRNFETSPFLSQISLHVNDFLKHEFAGNFDLIFTNPPFYEDKLKGQNESVNLAKHVSQLTPELLMIKAKQILSETGSFWIIWPSDRIEKITTIAESLGFYTKTKIAINGKPETPVRVILELVLYTANSSNRDFTIRDTFGNYTEEYKILTRDFHNIEL